MFFQCSSSFQVKAYKCIAHVNQIWCNFCSRTSSYSIKNRGHHLGLVVDVSISLSLATVWLTSYQIWVLIFTVEVWNVKTKLYSGISENEFILKREVNIKKSRLRPQLWTNHDCLVGKKKKKRESEGCELKTNLCYKRSYKMRVVGNIKQSKGVRVWSNSKV